ncbi:MAG: hypothetical protein DRO15_06685, partial [Thermoprotei archaeon]
MPFILNVYNNSIRSHTGDTLPIWILRDFERCTGCRLCEMVCSLEHEGVVWFEASRIKVFKLFPG